ncbi:hypothetical protein QBC36DRAFT_248905 [Triangularia setosa]|uniref:Uncharacterized protein n=1 Tax=Triangularia setosa TaxID=2587417 RepID=A0AAN6VYQ1_9PEZI|nr:hypothetical protein QBC36DRAFT_248905 [Podospora setosa]
MRARQILLALPANLSVGDCLPSQPSTLETKTVKLGDPHDDSGGILWRGSIFPGGPKVKLQGSVHEICDQIYIRNPDFQPLTGYFKKHGTTNNVSKREDPWEWDNTLTNVQGIAGPDHFYQGHIPANWKYNSLKCAPMAMGYMPDIRRNSAILSSLPGKCGAPANSCRRMMCEQTTALYFCNDLDTQLDVDCSEAAEYVKQIWDNCCMRQMTTSGLTRSKEGFSIWVGYGNCNHDADVPPWEYKIGEGNNKMCKAPMSLFMDAKSKWIITAPGGIKGRNPAEEDRLHRERRERDRNPFGLPQKTGIPLPGDVDHCC